MFGIHECIHERINSSVTENQNNKDRGMGEVCAVSLANCFKATQQDALCNDAKASSTVTKQRNQNQQRKIPLSATCTLDFSPHVGCKTSYGKEEDIVNTKIQAMRQRHVERNVRHRNNSVVATPRYNPETAKPCT